jgi:hypothetical protein
MTFAYSIHVPTAVNVFPKAVVDDVFVQHPIMAMIAEMVKEFIFKLVLKFLVIVYRPNPCDNIYCGYGQCREGICECHGGYSGSRCDVARKFFFASK